MSAPAYRQPRPHTVLTPALRITATQAPDSEQQDQLLFGEVFDLLDTTGDQAWGQARRDGYVGYVDLAALGADPGLPTHRVSAIRTYAFSEPSIKSRALGPYSLNCLISIQAREGRFLKGANTGWFVAEHLSPIGSFAGEPAAVAELHLGAAYLWGGRESHGLDCSGLVQQALLACGRACPRDTDQQQTLGQDIDPEALARGDLVFWKGHVAMMVSQTHIIHANAHHMAVATEPLAEAWSRIARTTTGDPVAFRRL